MNIFCTPNNPTPDPHLVGLLEIYTVIIIDVGVLVDVRMFESPRIAERYILEYVNAPDEVRKRGGKPLKFINYLQFVRWMDKNPSFVARIVFNSFRVRP